MSSEKRSQPRFLTELDLVLYDRAGIVIDDRAQAHDLNTGGFRAETRVKLPEKTRVRFAIRLDEDDDVKGEAVIVWVAEDQWGWYNSGAKIVRISWADARKIRKHVTTPGYDFVGLAKRAAIAAYWIIIVVGIQAALMSPHVRHTLFKLAPVLPAVVILGWSLTTLLTRD